MFYGKIFLLFCYLCKWLHDSVPFSHNMPLFHPALIIILIIIIVYYLSRYSLRLCSIWYFVLKPIYQFPGTQQHGRPTEESDSMDERWNGVWVGEGEPAILGAGSCAHNSLGRTKPVSLNWIDGCLLCTHYIRVAIIHSTAGCVSPVQMPSPRAYILVYVYTVYV